MLSRVSEAVRMARRNGPWNSRRSRRPRSWNLRFAGLVVAVASVAFYLTLAWPILEAGEPRGLTGGSPPQIAQSSVPSGSLTCPVAYITDGDTLRCRDGTRIRLHAVAARESDGSCSPGHPCPSASASAATAELRRLAAGKTISCEPTGQSYNRITAICWTPSGEEINCAMVRSGVALVWDRFNREEPICRS